MIKKALTGKLIKRPNQTRENWWRCGEKSVIGRERVVKSPGMQMCQVSLRHNKKTGVATDGQMEM